MGRPWNHSENFPSIELALALSRFPPQYQVAFRRHPVFFPAPVYQEIYIPPTPPPMPPAQQVMPPPEPVAQVAVLDLSLYPIMESKDEESAE
ncbi:hypothetical protein SISSUDRAFT_779263 [Sistotremastrum suecicum HHB10207 ss-3]|uniref:Uncharacterized protein n=1 Tax=Sistotremastrum suecicum HHB10207 ss-3 TaxID=1314776 RepID=A0A166D725_9AGAM|nr:hypothetical protein SISSUDRAFT_779263 [Sistotremastrum suecicum HHB10207 ss-3]